MCKSRLDAAVKEMVADFFRKDTVRFTCDKPNQIKAHPANEDWLSESELQDLTVELTSLEISGSEGVYETDNGRLMRIDINFNNKELDK